MTARRVAVAWDRLRSSLWFLPALIVAGLATMAIILIEVDSAIDAGTLARFPRIFGAGAEGTRGMLEAIAGSMITVAGVTFSITIVALAQTASQYSPRVLRNFVRDGSNQTVLGIFVGIYAYCLIVLRTIRSDGVPFVPSIATLGAVILAFVGVALLIHFIHHITRAIQADHILAAIHGETSRAVARLYPESLGSGADLPIDPAYVGVACASGRLIDAGATGYVQSIDGGALIKLAVDNDVWAAAGSVDTDLSFLRLLERNRTDITQR